MSTRRLTGTRSVAPSDPSREADICRSPKTWTLLALVYSCTDGEWSVGWTLPGESIEVGNRSPRPRGEGLQGKGGIQDVKSFGGREEIPVSYRGREGPRRATGVLEQGSKDRRSVTAYVTKRTRTSPHVWSR